ncbi:SusC/RagA family TonB-linked outer membrane protein [Chitinophaga nivalis]|uniref:TonB-dependent receptor n=1 Tax=Chitinophaga nivalis TaxID=2991709 RepID=A0ABT3ITC1_9BACT|nr:TonB-dependent receptor [Chitinophaga nivalis]MCW3463087.1 TonB-dependent receptor [Chitinophaga nivalis]MCW3487223.1 TonB-dependent receptor [Chitinophaga nivalis]
MKKYHSRLCCLAACLLFYLPLRAQTVTIEGNIAGKDKSPLLGVTVSVKGRNIGTQSDASGHYRLQLKDPGNAVLLFSFIGFLPKEEPINGRHIISVVLEEDQKKLDEIVVVGYGQQKKKDVTGAIATIGAQAIRDVPVTNVQQALQGRTPGVEVLSNSAKPGDEPTVRIRGARSLSASNDPLYVVDGIPYSGSLNDIGTGTIQSMDILKDASATAIYGSRGANGVVLITTTRGKNSKPVVSYSGSYGYVHALGQTDMMDAAQFAEMRREANRTVGRYNDSKPDSSDRAIFNPVEYANLKKGTNTNWQQLLLSSGYQTNHALSVAGGTEKTKYALGIGYFKDQGVLKLQGYERYNVNISLDQLIGSRIKVGASLLGSYSTRRGETYNGVDQAIKMVPLGAPYDENGKLITFPNDDSNQPNPLLDYVDGNRVENRNRFRLFTSLYGEVEIISGLKYRLNVGPDISQYNYGIFQGKNNTNLLVGGGDGTASKTSGQTIAYTIENVLTYNKTIHQRHNIGFTGLYSVQRQRGDSSTAAVRGVLVENQEYYNLGHAQNVTGVGSSLGTWTILSYMGRLNYGYDDRYLITLTLRADGSSRFAPGKQWGYFPSVALAWNMKNEHWMRGATWLDNLKLRASYGRTGNTGIDPYVTQGLLARTVYSFGGKGVLGYTPQMIRNPNLTWETTTSFDVGFDFSMFNGRLTGSGDVYYQKTTDLLMPYLLPYSNGFNSVLRNVGATRNLGLEAGVSGIIVDNPKGFTWSTDLNFFLNRSQILELMDNKQADVGNAWFVGQPTYVYYDYKKIGIWQMDEAKAAAGYKLKPGEIKLEDVNNDGKIDGSDRQILGSPQPSWSAGMTQRFSYKGFELSLVAFARIGGMIKSDFYQNYNSLSGRFNILNNDYFTPANPSNVIPRPNANQERPSNYQSLSYFDGSFFKIRNITLAYALPAPVVKRMQMQDLRVNVGVKQPLILAPYRQQWKGVDPEDVNVIGIDAPATWMLQVGVNARF